MDFCAAGHVVGAVYDRASFLDSRKTERSQTAPTDLRATTTRTCSPARI